jgi:hypothetical protein
MMGYERSRGLKIHCIDKKSLGIFEKQPRSDNAIILCIRAKSANGNLAKILQN